VYPETYVPGLVYYGVAKGKKEKRVTFFFENYSFFLAFCRSSFQTRKLTEN